MCRGTLESLCPDLHASPAGAKQTPSCEAAPEEGVEAEPLAEPAVQDPNAGFPNGHSKQRTGDTEEALLKTATPSPRPPRFLPGPTPEPTKIAYEKAIHLQKGFSLPSHLVGYAPEAIRGRRGKVGESGASIRERDWRSLRF